MRNDDLHRFLRTGLIPSLTGGLFFNSEAPEDVVLLQFYFWLALFVIPISIALESKVTQATSIVYSVLVGLAFLLLGVFNAKLHAVLDAEAANDDGNTNDGAVTQAVGTSASNEQTSDGDASASITASGVASGGRAASSVIDDDPNRHNMPTSSLQQLHDDVRLRGLLARAAPPSRPPPPRRLDARSGAPYHNPVYDPSALHDVDLTEPVEAYRPPSLQTREHGHRLYRTSHPYGESGFICDICQKPGDKWAYHCPICQFDAHFECARSPSPLGRAVEDDVTAETGAAAGAAVGIGHIDSQDSLRNSVVANHAADNGRAALREGTPAAPSSEETTYELPLGASVEPPDESTNIYEEPFFPTADATHQPSDRNESSSGVGSQPTSDAPPPLPPPRPSTLPTAAVDPTPTTTEEADASGGQNVDAGPTEARGGPADVTSGDAAILMAGPRDAGRGTSPYNEDLESVIARMNAVLAGMGMEPLILPSSGSNEAAAAHSDGPDMPPLVDAFESGSGASHAHATSSQHAQTVALDTAPRLPGVVDGCTMMPVAGMDEEDGNDTVGRQANNDTRATNNVNDDSANDHADAGAGAVASPSSSSKNGPYLPGVLDGCTMRPVDTESEARGDNTSQLTRRSGRVFVRSRPESSSARLGVNLDTDGSTSRRVTIRLRSPTTAVALLNQNPTYEPMVPPRPHRPVRRPSTRRSESWVDDEDGGSEMVSLHATMAHPHPMYNATARRTAWQCNLCHGAYRHGPIRFRCTRGCDFDMCQHCMSMTSTRVHRGRARGADGHGDSGRRSDAIDNDSFTEGRLRHGPLDHHQRRLRSWSLGGYPSVRDDNNDLDDDEDGMPWPPPPRLRRLESLAASAAPTSAPTSASAAVSDHDDTSPGSLHFFEDENGNRHWYRFGDGTETDSTDLPIDANQLGGLFERVRALEDRQLRIPQIPLPLPRHPHRQRRPAVSQSSSPKRKMPQRTIQFGRFTFKLAFDRLMLSHAFDKKPWPGLMVVSRDAVLAALSSYVAFEVTSVVGPTATVFTWFAAGTAQYSLVKSVQPDAGTSLVNERGTAYMRCVYFLIFGGLFLGIRSMDVGNGGMLYGIQWRRFLTASYAHDIALGLIVCLPLIWLFGHLPMWWRTALHWALEQVDSVWLGGGGSKSLAGALVRFGVTLVALWCCILSAGFLSSAAITNTRMGLFQFTCVFFAFMVARCPADPRLVANAVRHMWSSSASDLQAQRKTQLDASHVLAQRLVWDPFRALLYGIVFFILHVTDAIGASKDYLSPIVICIAVGVGFLRHHVLHQVGRPYPWKTFKGPLYHGENEARRRRAHVLAFASLIEHDVLYPLVVAYGIAAESKSDGLFDRFGDQGGAVLLALASFKVLRIGYSDGTMLWLALGIAWLVAQFESSSSALSEGLLLDTAVMHIIVVKMAELMKKLGFVFVYNAPSNRLMSAFHAIIFPLQKPHAAMLIFQAAIASLFSAPLYPVAGSTLFLVSYLRPIKFFERRYTTTRLTNDADATMVRYKVGATADNLNSIFYMDVQARLREQLATDIEGGVFGDVSAGDIFLLMCNQGTMHMISILHIIDKGRGYVSFQLRGLELAGTFCQNREAEALDAEGEWEDPKLQCDACQPFNMVSNRGRLLPIKLMRNLRWKTWERETSNYVLKKGYSISLLNAHQYFPDRSSFRLFRKLMFQATMYMAMASGHLNEWLDNDKVTAHLDEIMRTGDRFVERGTYLTLGMSGALDSDYHHGFGHGQGLSMDSFQEVYSEWITHCGTVLEFDIGDSDGDLESQKRNQTLLWWFFSVSIVQRRLLAAFMPGIFNIHGRPDRRSARTDVVRREELFQGYHRLFEGRVDLKIAKGEWLSELTGFEDMLVRAARMTLRLYQDQYSDDGCFESLDYLAETLDEYISEAPGVMVVSGETDPEWNSGLLEGTQTMLSFRHNIEQTSNNDGYFVVLLVRASPENKVFRLNQESIRGLWASQQQELLYFRNVDAERGSIQNAKMVLRNIANQSCDQPVGYPIYISEIDHSFTASHPTRGPFQHVMSVARAARSWFTRLHKQPPTDQAANLMGAVEAGQASAAAPAAATAVNDASVVADIESIFGACVVSPLHGDFEEDDTIESSPVPHGPLQTRRDEPPLVTEEPAAETRPESSALAPLDI
eukprot:m.111083 g.111083  ORF g.111083 m.111083 type:complete len:2150 (-) comp10741_c0_seq1:114-6563(-)